jgi:hypothetical protein
MPVIIMLIATKVPTTQSEPVGQWRQILDIAYSGWILADSPLSVDPDI